MFRFRSAFYKLLPGIFTIGDGEKLLYSLNILLDAYTTKMRAGLEARFPSRAGASSQALIGKDRGIIRGRDETRAHYAERLKRWRYPRGHRVRGNDFATLEQISEYFGGIRCWTIDRNQTRCLRDENGDQSYAFDYAWDWDGAAATPRWARFWLVLEPNPEIAVSKHEAIDDPALWGGCTFDEAVEAGYTLDCKGISYQDAQAIIGLFRHGGGRRAWKPAGTKAEFAVIVLTDHTVSADPAPDGSWNTNTGRDDAFGYWPLS
jgi:hypothetical protein